MNAAADDPSSRPRRLRPSGGYRELRSFQTSTLIYDGTSEQLAAARLAFRKKDPSDRTDQTDRDFPRCPQCGKLMALRTARQGKNQGSQFWGCTGYPDCKGAVPLDPSSSDRSV